LLLKKLLLKISDNVKKQNAFISLTYHLNRKIVGILPWYVCDKFFYTQGLSLHNLYCKEKNRLSKKYYWLKKDKVVTNDNNINDIKYYCSSTKQIKRYSFHGPPIDSIHTIVLKPSNFSNKGVDLLEPRKDWFINVSDIPIPQEVTGLTQLGENFCLLTLNKTKDTIECIKAVEDNFYRLRIKNNNAFRNKFFPIISNFNKNNNKKNEHEILSAFSLTKKFISNNPNILFTRVDKGNTVVAIYNIRCKNRRNFFGQ